MRRPREGVGAHSNGYPIQTDGDKNYINDRIGSEFRTNKVNYHCELGDDRGHPDGLATKEAKVDEDLEEDQDADDEVDRKEDLQHEPNQKTTKEN